MGLSAYFRDMETPPPSRTRATTRAGSPETVVRVKGRDHVFAQLLGYYISPNPTRIRQWETARQLLLLGKRYQFTNLPRLIVPYIYTITMDDPWATFVFASQHDFSALAKEAVRHLGGDAYWGEVTIATLEHERLKDVPSKYMLALLQSMEAGKSESGNKESSGFSWWLASFRFHVRSDSVL